MRMQNATNTDTTENRDAFSVLTLVYCDDAADARIDECVFGVLQSMQGCMVYARQYSSVYLDFVNKRHDERKSSTHW